MSFCNICGNENFLAHRSRNNIRCSFCGSLDTQRMFGLVALEIIGSSRMDAQSKFTLISGSTSLDMVSQIAPDRFVQRSASEILGGSGFHSLLLADGFTAFESTHPSSVLASLRAKIDPLGTIAFRIRLEHRSEPVTVIRPSNSHERPTYIFGHSAPAWFALQPGWAMSIWVPPPSLAPSIEDMHLRYRKTESPIILARPAVHS